MDEEKKSVQTEKPAPVNRRGFLRSMGVAAAAAGAGLVAGQAGAADGPVAPAGMDPYLGEIAMFAFNFTPYGWMPCDGRLLAISQYSALYSLLGTQYGGNGTTNFALPNLNGRFPLCLSGTHTQGEQGGSETVTLTQTQMPAHTHAASASSAQANQRGPGGNVLAREAMGQDAVYSSQSPDVTMSGNAVGMAGGGQAHNNMPPYLSLNFCIAVEGVFPQRS